MKTAMNIWVEEGERKEGLFRRLLDPSLSL